MAGIPPLIGFFAKFYVFFAAVESNFYFLLTLSILCSTLSAFYYIRVIKIINFERILNPKILVLKTSQPIYLYILIGILFIICSFAIPNYLMIKTYSLVLFLA
jgi:NADH-quinone oxidoreductase subunit N